MICPHCGSHNQYVVLTRQTHDGLITRRTRKCQDCKRTFHTRETMMLEGDQTIVKTSNSSRDTEDTGSFY